MTTESKKKDPLYYSMKPSPEHEHIISALVENRPGVLAHISGMFAARGFNISSLAVGTTVDPEVSRMTIACKGDDRVIDQINKQLAKIVDVIRVLDMREVEHVERELILAKVRANGASRSEIMQIADIFRARFVDIHHDAVIVEASGSRDKINALIEMLEPFGILEISRTGRVALSRGHNSLENPALNA